MKLTSLSPKRLFRSKKNKQLSHPLSFGSGSSSSDGSTHKPQTPTTVLPDHRFHLAQAFRLIDRDNDGLLTRHDLEALLTRLGAPDVSAMLADVAADAISVDSLADRLLDSPSHPDDLKEVFQVFDTDRDGRISAEELLRVFHAIGDDRCTLDDCRRMIEGVDSNGDGFVCFQDFSLMMDRF
ncbi:hypothetical protein Fmac_029661 [Flemingia macrophylla]|uniref:EF-hand domain-containing protein n=1 Tax=Flemingia macrophylla TaxID=520843 RepID=A0ABD1LAZ8_9FABA